MVSTRIRFQRAGGATVFTPEVDRSATQIEPAGTADREGIPSVGVVVRPDPPLLIVEARNEILFAGGGGGGGPRLTGWSATCLATSPAPAWPLFGVIVRAPVWP